ncbi:MAG: hypothetical protein HY725_06660 [Candidatus Rokubacteria bacterium]|nr:hypothetical protein [Candidatus Rokubacteria bacterium]
MLSTVFGRFSRFVCVVLACILMAVTVLAASYSPAQPPGGAGAKHLNVVLGFGPSNLDPDLSVYGLALTLWISMFDSLTRFDENMKVQPALATSWKMINETTWEFKLRSGVKFHNGEPFNAQVAKFSLDRILDPKQKTQNLSRMPLLQRVEVVDDMTVRLYTKSPSPTLPLGLVWGWMKPPKYLKEKGDAHFAQNPVGTGPFKFVDWVQGQYINMVSNPEYWQGKPKLDKLTIKIVPDPSVQVASLRAGEAQLISDVPVHVAKQIQATKGLKVVPAPFGSVTVVNLYSHEGGPLADKRVRQALNYAINKQLILDRILQGYSTIAQGQVVTPEAFGFDPETKAYPYDPQKAKQLLAEAGYPNGFRMPLTSSWGRYPMDKEICIAMADQLGKVGVQVDLKDYEWGVSQDLTKKLQMPNRFTAWMNYGDARFGLQWGMSNSNLPFWRNPQFDRLMEQSDTTVDPKQREQLLRQAIRYEREEAPMIFMFQNAFIFGMSERLTGWKPHFSGWLYFHQADLKS